MRFNRCSVCVGTTRAAPARFSASAANRFTAKCTNTASRSDVAFLSFCQLSQNMTEHIRLKAYGLCPGPLIGAVVAVKETPPVTACYPAQPLVFLLNTLISTLPFPVGFSALEGTLILWNPSCSSGEANRGGALRIFCRLGCERTTHCLTTSITTDFAATWVHARQGGADLDQW